MEFHEKLQKLRKQKNLTQEEAAQKLFVSRTAVSKWESGRGYPSIESLKAIARLYGVTVDALLSGDEVVSLAEEEHKQLRERVFFLADMGAVLLFLLPLFGQMTDGAAQAVTIWQFAGAMYLRVAYFIIAAGMPVAGLLGLVLQRRQAAYTLSFAVHAAGVLIFVASRQPYAAVLLLALMAIKVFAQRKAR